MGLHRIALYRVRGEVFEVEGVAAEFQRGGDDDCIPIENTQPTSCDFQEFRIDDSKDKEDADEKTDSKTDDEE